MNNMKTHMFLLISVVLASCTVTVPPPPVAEQRADLGDPDRDGVITARDNCADTAQGSVINNDGCPNLITIEEDKSLRIMFAHNDASIESSYGVPIEEMAEFLLNYPDTSLELQGHASQPGTKAYNMQLSLIRASAVRDALIEKGVEENRLKAVGFGESTPILEETDELSQQVNRRVVAEVTGLDEEAEKAWTIFTRREK